jgi:hypothetical protein
MEEPTLIGPTSNLLYALLSFRITKSKKSLSSRLNMSCHTTPHSGHWPTHFALISPPPPPSSTYHLPLYSDVGGTLLGYGVGTISRTQQRSAESVNMHLTLHVASVNNQETNVLSVRWKKHSTNTLLNEQSDQRNYVHWQNTSCPRCFTFLSISTSDGTMQPLFPLALHSEMARIKRRRPRNLPTGPSAVR